MKYVSFLLFASLITSLANAGPEDRWVPVESVGEETVGDVNAQTAESAGQEIDGIALLLAVGAFAWVYVIYRDLKAKKRRK